MSKMFENEYIDKHRGIPWETTTTELRTIINEHGRLPVSCSNVVLIIEPSIEHHLTEYETKAFADVGALFLFEQISTIGCHPDILGMSRNDTITLCITFGYDPGPRTCVSTYNHILTPKASGLYAAKLGYFDQGSVDQLVEMGEPELNTFLNDMRVYSSITNLGTWVEYRDKLPKGVNEKVLRATTGMVYDGHEIGGYDVGRLLELDTNILRYSIHCQFINRDGNVHLMTVIGTDDSVPTLHDFKYILDNVSLLKYSDKFTVRLVSEFADMLYQEASGVGDLNHVYKYCDFLPKSEDVEYTDHIAKLICVGGLGDDYVLTDTDKLIIDNFDKKNYSATRLLFRMNMVDWYGYTWTTHMFLYNISRIIGNGLTPKSVHSINALIDEDINTFEEIDKFLVEHSELSLTDIMNVPPEPSYDMKVKSVKRMLCTFPKESPTATTVWPEVVEYMKRDKSELALDPIFNDVWKEQITTTNPISTSFYDRYQPWQRTSFLPNTTSEIVSSINQTPFVLWNRSDGWIYDAIGNLPKSAENTLRVIYDGLNINGKYLLDKSISNQTEISMHEDSIFSQWIALGNKIELLKNNRHLPEILKRYL